jgi:hypothetical protein
VNYEAIDSTRNRQYACVMRLMTCAADQSDIAGLVVAAVGAMYQVVQLQTAR